MDPTQTFEEHRSTLIGAAYRILGSRVEAEDAVQEAWIRWSGVDQWEHPHRIQPQPAGRGAGGLELAGSALRVPARRGARRRYGPG